MSATVTGHTNMKVWTTVDKRNGRPDLSVATPEKVVPDDQPYIVLHEAEYLRMVALADGLLNHCNKDGGECRVCGAICCPQKDPMHFHHDGCPSCAQVKCEACSDTREVTDTEGNNWPCYRCAYKSDELNNSTGEQR